MINAKFIKPIYENYLIKQLLFFSLGFLLIFLLKKIKIRNFLYYSHHLYFLGIILLILVLFLGSNVNGAKAWFNFKIFSFQPSEAMKLFLILILAFYTDKFKEKKISEFKYIIISLVLVLIPSILVFLEPDTGAIVFFLILLLSTFLTAKISKRWFIIAFFTLLILITSFLYLYFLKTDLLIRLIGTSFFYRVERILEFKKGLQINNALTTIGNTNMFGFGIKKDLLYVPEFPTDFVFTLALSIFGFIGGLVILSCYFMINYYFIKCSFNTNKTYMKIIINGFISILLFSEIYNILMNLGILPIMGIPLPFLSYGGSNMIVYFLFIGIILNEKRTIS